MKNRAIADARDTRGAHGTPEIALWRAVILNAMVDGTLPSCTKEQKELVKKQARSWFNLNDKGFIAVCIAAGLEPDCVIKAFHRKTGRKFNDGRMRPRFTHRGDN